MMMVVKIFAFGIQHRGRQHRDQPTVRRGDGHEVDRRRHVRHALLHAFAGIGQRLEHLLFRRAIQGRDRGADRHPVAGQFHCREVLLQQGPELVEIELLDVIIVVVAGLVGVDLLVRRGHDQNAVRAQHAPDLGHHFILLQQVLDGLEGHHDIHAVIGKRNGRCRTLQILQVAERGIPLGSMVHCIVGNIHAAHRARFGGQHGAAIAFATGDIEHVLAFHQRQAPRIAMQVFLPDHAVLSGHKALAGKLDHRDSLETSMDSIGNPIRPNRMVSSSARNSSASWIQCCCVWSCWSPEATATSTM